MTTPKFHAFCYCTVGSREELERGMIGKDGRLYQRMLKNLGEYVRICDDAGFAGKDTRIDRVRDGGIHDPPSTPIFRVMVFGPLAEIEFEHDAIGVGFIDGEAHIGEAHCPHSLAMVGVGVDSALNLVSEALGRGKADGVENL